jgi:serine phosphatase RsbU (regulator of sigma subunit)
MKNLNEALADDLIGNNCFITMVVARYRPSTGELAYTNAGHIYPLVWSHRSVATKSAKVEPNFLKARGIPLGILPIWRGKSGTLQLSPGDVFLLTSDGLTEATVTNADPSIEGIKVGSMLEQEGLWEILLQEDDPLDVNSVLDRVREVAQQQEDDQTILSLEVL